MKNFITNIKYSYIKLASVITMIVVWELLALYYHSNFILPGPFETASAAIKLLFTKDFIFVAGTTLLRGIIGFAIAAILGVGIGIIAGINPSFNAFISPILIVIRSVPVIAITLLALIWFKSNHVPIFIGLLTMFPLICTNVIEGIKNVDRNLIEMAQLYGIKRGKIVGEVYIPAIAPFIFSGMSSAAGIGWRAIIVGEVLSQPKYGIGTVMHTAQTYLNIDILIAWTVIAILISYCFEMLLKLIRRKTVKWDR